VLLHRGRLSRPSRMEISGGAADVDGEVGARKLPTSPIYPRYLAPPAARAETARDRLTRLMANGRYCSATEMLEQAAAVDCAAVLGELLSSGYAFDRAGDRIRLRARGDREVRQRLVEVLDGISLVTEEESEPPAAEASVVKKATVRMAAPARSAPVGEGLLVFADNPDDMSMSAAEWGVATRAVLAKRGSGKTYFAGVMLEEVLARGGGPEVVVIDPGGAWWGLLSTAAGDPSPHKILLLGGPHGHLPLAVGDGGAAARVVGAVRPVTVILDLSELAPVEQHELVADFCDGLWALEHFPLQLFVDEADEFAPQRFGALSHHQRRSLDCLSRMFMRGRGRGMGGTLISLRPAVLAKNLLSQVDELCLGRLVESNDIRAAATWLENFEHQVTAHQRVDCLSHLPVLTTGTIYFLRGGDSPMFRRFRVRKKLTYDSSRTLTSETRGRPTLSSPGQEILDVARKLLGKE
jgi:hypothetical protein